MLAAMSEHYEHEGEAPKPLEPSYDTMAERELELGNSLARILARIMDEIDLERAEFARQDALEAQADLDKASRLLAEVERKSALGEIP